MILLALALLGAPADVDELDYLLGSFRLPPVAVPADPFRLADLRFSWEDAGRQVARFEGRTRLGASIFVGGEVASGSRGVFFDTQRLEIGFTESDGQPVVEGAFRAPWFLVDVRADRSERGWAFDSEGAVRFGRDLELLLGFRDASDGVRNETASLARFIATGQIPAPGLPTRELRSLSAGFLYQRGNHLELVSRLARSQLRSEAGFDFDRDRVEIATVWNRANFEIEAELDHERNHGRLASDITLAGLGATIALGRHLVARASTAQVWEQGLLRFHEEYRAGATWYGRRFRFARASEIGDRVLELQRRAHELGYNERRVYDVEALRAFRERLGISPARAELGDALDALYRAQVRERNVPELGFELVLAEDALGAVDSRTYRAFVGVPWPVAFPFARREAVVDFLKVELRYRDERYPAGVRAKSPAVKLVLFLNRETSLRVSWESFGRTPDDIVRQRTRASRLLVGFDYAFGQ